jgi:hypothetical protein
MMLEAGDVIKFAELAWKVIDYGWSDELNASESSRQELPRLHLFVD